MTHANAIILHDVTKTYREGRAAPTRTALDRISITIPSGQRVALLGPNGSGKSTLLKILCLAHAPTSGSVQALGISLFPAPSNAQRRAYLASLGVVFQSPGLDKLLTARENLLAFGAILDLPRAALTDRITSLARALDITDRLDDRVKTLSGGLARRVDLARAVLHAPRLLLLDEASTGLDVQARRDFLSVVDALARDSGMTVVMTTHLIDEAERADRVLMLAKGRLVADGSPADLRAKVAGSTLRLQRTPSNAFTNALARAAASGLTVINDDHAAVTLRGEPAPLRALIDDALAHNLPFEYGPPTLADAYLAATGQPLDTETADA